MTEKSGTSSGKPYKLTRLLRDSAIMVVLLAGFMLLQTEIRQQFNPLYQESTAAAGKKTGVAGFYRSGHNGNIVNDPGAAYATMPFFQSVDELDKIAPAAGE